MTDHTPVPVIDTDSRISDYCEICLNVCGMPHELIESLSGSMAWRWNSNGRWLDPEDIRQEAWLAYFSHRDEVDKALAEGERSRAWTMVRDDVWRYCRREKAARGGYDPGDEYFYGLKALRALLPAVFGGDVAQEGGVSVEARRGPSKGAGSGSDPDTMIVDVRWGLEQMSWVDRELLFDVYAQPKGESSHPDFARGKAALKRLQQVLGGPPN